MSNPHAPPREDPPETAPPQPAAVALASRRRRLAATAMDWGVRRMSLAVGFATLAGGGIGLYRGNVVFEVMCAGTPITVADADFDKDGHVSFLEADYACEGGVRAVVQEGRQCTEYFAYKDGLPVKVTCP